MQSTPTQDPPRGAGIGSHLVQFYEGEEFLYDAVTRYLGAGLAGGEGVIVIAVSAHLDGLRERLSKNSFDVDRACESGQLTLLDAHETLATFVVDGRADPIRFFGTIVPVVETSGRGRNGIVRAYGEMVDVLCQQGDHATALELEQLWNDLIGERSLSLLCGYSIKSFARAEHAERFHGVCKVHTHVVPAESFSELRTDDARLREVSLLQQRARALETEVEHRKLLERSLRQREAELDDLVENAVDCIHRVAADGTIVWANQSELALLGYTADEYIGQSITKFHVDEEVIGGILSRLTGGETLKGVEARLRAKDGSLRHVLISSNVYRRDGEFVHTRCFSHDITDRKLAEVERARAYEAARRAEEKAQLERRRLHDLFMQAPASICILRGAEHVVEFANRAASELFAGRELLGRPLASVLPDLEETALRLLDEVFRTGERYTATEMPSLLDWGGNGRAYERFFNIAYEPFLDDIGGTVGVVTFALEVTEQVLARRKIETIAHELELANRTKDDFLATVSHELRTPLSAILGWTRMLRSGMVSDGRRDKALETIERNANAQTQLIEDLLDVSRIISGKMRLDIAAVDVAQVVGNAIDAVRPAANAKGVEMSQTLDPMAGPILGDGDRLQQVVWNLLSNAVKFTAKGGRVQVFVRKVSSFIEIIVADNGQGIEPEFLPRMFEKFRQADPTTARKHTGLGLGLAIVRHLVELHGGHVKVESAGLGAGASFMVCLPISSLRSTVERAPAVREPLVVQPFTCPLELENVHILVLEDEEDGRELLRQVLEPCKARVSTAATVPEAMQMIERMRPDIIVSDIALPDEDGYSFIKKVRALPADRGGRTPAVALTAYTRLEDRTKALMAGFNMHVPKPVEPSELIAVLSSLSTLFPKN